MTLTVPVTHKFACLSFKNVFCKYGGGPIKLLNDLSVYVRPKSSLDTQWLGMLCAIDHETLGSLDHEKLTNSNFLILATAPTTTPKHGNDDNERLIERTLHLFHGILMHGVPHHEDGLLISGANVDDRVEVHTLQPLPTYYSWRHHLLKNGPDDLDEKTIKSAGVVAQGLSFVESQSGDFCRLKRGIHAWVRAVQERSYFDRLHEFVRATEARLKPKQGETRKQFIYNRCKTLAGDDQQTGNLLGEIYDLRSAAEHLNDWGTVLASIPQTEREQHAGQRAFQAEFLAGRSYIRLLSRTDLREHFRSDDKIERFWKLENTERQQCWGSPVNLTALQP